jgi:hypothetical protein
MTISSADHTTYMLNLDFVGEWPGAPRPRRVLVVLDDHVSPKCRDVPYGRSVTFRTLPRPYIPLSTMQTRPSAARGLCTCRLASTALLTFVATPTLCRLRIAQNNRFIYVATHRLDTYKLVMIQLPVPSWRTAHALRAGYSPGLRRLKDDAKFKLPVRDVLLYTGVNF